VNPLAPPGHPLTVACARRPVCHPSRTADLHRRPRQNTAVPALEYFVFRHGGVDLGREIGDPHVSQPTSTVAMAIASLFTIGANWETSFANLLLSGQDTRPGWRWIRQSCRFSPKIKNNYLKKLISIADLSSARCLSARRLRGLATHDDSSIAIASEIDVKLQRQFDRALDRLAGSIAFRHRPPGGSGTLVK
jgi:hypothetical protein